MTDGPKFTTREELEALMARVRASSDRTGKPSGAHMIDSQRMIAKHFSQSDDQDARDVADVADCMAHCIENEALLFECLKTDALALVDHLSRVTLAHGHLVEEAK